MKATTMVADWVGTRPDGLMGDMPAGSSHWRCVLRHDGRRMTVYFSMGPALTGEPKVSEVMESLLSDSLVEQDFHEFCRDMGYDEDSRKAERVHKACLRIRDRLRVLLDTDDLAEVWNKAQAAEAGGS